MPIGIGPKQVGPSTCLMEPFTLPRRQVYVGDVTDEALRQYTERIQRSLATHYLSNARSFTFQASVGIAICDGVADPPELFRDAEIALWCAKESGSGAVRYFDSSMAARL